MMSSRPACRPCAAELSAYRSEGEPEGLCAACAAAEAPVGVWRVLDPEELVLAVAGVLASAAADRPGERVHVQPRWRTGGSSPTASTCTSRSRSCGGATAGSSGRSRDCPATGSRCGRTASRARAARVDG